VPGLLCVGEEKANRRCRVGVVGAETGNGVRRTGDVARGEDGVTSEWSTVVKISFDCSGRHNHLSGITHWIDTEKCQLHGVTTCTWAVSF
jgi:hypothetical protein